MYLRTKLQISSLTLTSFRQGWKWGWVSFSTPTTTTSKKTPEESPSWSGWIVNIWKRKKKEKKEKDINWMENFKIESRYPKLCYEFRAFISCMKAAFYRPDYQKFLMCPSIKRLGQAFISKNAAEPLKRSAKLLKHSVELLSV